MNRRVRERMSQRRGSTVFRKGKGTHHSFPMPINICSLVLSVFDESNWLKVPPQFFFLHILMLFLMKGTYQFKIERRKQSFIYNFDLFFPREAGVTSCSKRSISWVEHGDQKD